jgi:hypothetical protein
MRNNFPVLSSFMTYHRVCNYINTTDVTSGAGTAYPSEHLSSHPVFSGVLVFFFGSLFVILYFFFWSLCYLFFFDIRILIAPLVSSNSF